MVRTNKPPLEVAAAVVVRLCGDDSLVIADTELHRFEQNIWASTSRNYRGTWRSISAHELRFEYAYEGLLDGKPEYPSVVSSAFVNNEKLRFDLLRQVPHPASGGDRKASAGTEAGVVVPLTLRRAETLPARLDTFMIPCGSTRLHFKTIHNMY